jgi:single-strand DNA-binding protein
MFSQESSAVNRKSTTTAQLPVYGGKEKPYQRSQAPLPLRTVPQNPPPHKLSPISPSGEIVQPAAEEARRSEQSPERDCLKLTLTGRVGRNARLRETNGGHTLVDFFVGTQDFCKNEVGQWKQKTTWYRVKKWGDSAAMLSPHLEEGARVQIDGKLAIRKWIDRNNLPQTSIEIVANDVRFLNQRFQTTAA